MVRNPPGATWASSVLLTLTLACTLPGAAGTQDDDWPDWVDENEQWRDAAARVNEGELVLLSQAPARAVHHHDSSVTITPRSLRDGWVALDQCHYDLDRVPATQIVFNPQRSRGLRITRTRNIARAYTEEHTVQLRDVDADAVVCVHAESQALSQLEDGVFELQNGPFMRRFLDGYYPLRLSLRIDYPPSLALADFTPAEQGGFSVARRPGSVRVEALFEGRLRTAFRFVED